MEKLSLRALKNEADIDVLQIIRAAGVSYFPWFEGNEKVAYAHCAEGWAGSLRRGNLSGLLYAVTDYGNDIYSPGRYALDLGARETAVMQRLDHVEVLQNRRETGYAVIKFAAEDGHSFTVSCTDDGHNWTVCG